jgi:hypothetical protein
MNAVIRPPSSFVRPEPTPKRAQVTFRALAQVSAAYLSGRSARHRLLPTHDVVGPEASPPWSVPFDAAPVDICAVVAEPERQTCEVTSHGTERFCHCDRVRCECPVGAVRGAVVEPDGSCSRRLTLRPGHPPEVAGVVTATRPEAAVESAEDTAAVTRVDNPRRTNLPGRFIVRAAVAEKRRKHARRAMSGATSRKQCSAERYA